MNCQKYLFSLPEGHHYLNCAYFSPLLKSVEEAGIRGIRSKRTPWTTEPADFFDQSQLLRQLFASIIHAEDENHIAIMPAVSYGMATVARNLPSIKGGNIIVAGEQFPSNVYPWMRFCRDTGAKLLTVTPPKNHPNRAEKWNERILNAINSETIMVALGNVHWTDGSLFDLKTIGDRVHETDGLLVVDGTQSVGALPFNVKEIKPDALICAGYKWLMGPYSMALGYFGERLLNGAPLEEGWIARKGSEHFSGLVDYEEEYQPGAIRYDVGERSNFILVPMMVKALEQIADWTPGGIQRYCRTLCVNLASEAKALGYLLEKDAWRAHHMFGIRMPAGSESRQIDRLAQKLNECNIHVSVRGTAIRVSPNVYNNADNISALIEVLGEIAKN